MRVRETYKNRILYYDLRVIRNALTICLCSNLQIGKILFIYGISELHYLDYNGFKLFRKHNFE